MSELNLMFLHQQNKCILGYAVKHTVFVVLHLRLVFSSPCFCYSWYTLWKGWQNLCIWGLGSTFSL